MLMTLAITPQLSVGVGGVSVTDWPGQEIVRSGGHVRFGACVSRTVTRMLHVLTRPFTSVAVNVTVVVPFGYVPEAFAPPPVYEFAIDATAQLSVAVASGTVTAAWHTLGSVPTVMFAGQVMTGFSTSVTVTLKAQVELFPLTSRAVTVTRVVPTAKAVPEFRLYVMDWTPQLSVAVARNVAGAEH